MKIAFLNFSGNVGKTTLARDMAKTALSDHEIIAIESVNSDGKEKIIIKGEDGDQLFTELLVNDRAIIDIGSSNLENYFKNASKESELISCIDTFVIPVTPERKQQADSLKTIKDLLEKGINPSAIHIVFNQVPDDGIEIEKKFADFIKLAKAAKVNVDSNNSIYKHDLYDTGKTLAELQSDEDFTALMEQAKAEGDMDTARKHAMALVRQKKVRKLGDTYQNIFSSILGG